MALESVTAEYDGGRSGLAEATVEERSAAADVGIFQIELELYRSRRYGRSFAVVAHPVVSPGAVAGLRALVRASDHVWIERGQLYVLAPEADREGAESLIARVAAIAPTLVDAALARVAVFPDDALTSGALLAAVAAPAARPALARVPADEVEQEAPRRKWLVGASRGSVLGGRERAAERASDGAPAT